MFPLDPAENIRKPNISYPLIRVRIAGGILVFLIFSGGSKENIRKKRVKVSFLAGISSHNITLFVVISNITKCFQMFSALICNASKKNHERLREAFTDGDHSFNTSAKLCEKLTFFTH